MTIRLHFASGRTIDVSPEVYAAMFEDDLFHEKLTNEQIAAVFGVMAACPQHTFQVLTKRAERMREWFARDVDHATECGEAAAAATGDSFASYSFGAGGPWPLPNVWLGVSCEDQRAADERIPHLLATPTALRFLSVEPCLSVIDLGSMRCEKCGGAGWLWGSELDGGEDPPTDTRYCCDRCRGRAIRWIIVGSESGPGARPCDLEWVRSVVRQCRAAGVAAFVKQLHIDGKLVKDMAEFPPDLRVREMPEPRR